MTSVVTPQQIITKYSKSPLKRELIARLRREGSLPAKKTRLSTRSAKALMQVRRTLRGLVEIKEAERWLVAPNALLGGVCPIDSIKQGNANQVREILAGVEEGIHV